MEGAGRAGVCPVARLVPSALGGQRQRGAILAVTASAEEMRLLTPGRAPELAGPTFGELLLYLALGWSKRTDAEEDLIGALMLRARLRVTPLSWRRYGLSGHRQVRSRGPRSEGIALDGKGASRGLGFSRMTRAPRPLALSLVLLAALAPVAFAGCELEPMPPQYSEERAPCADHNPLKKAYFGDLHVHTAFSFDASTYDVRTDAGRGVSIPRAARESGCRRSTRTAWGRRS